MLYIAFTHIVLVDCAKEAADDKMMLKTCVEDEAKVLNREGNQTVVDQHGDHPF